MLVRSGWSPLAAKASPPLFCMTRQSRIPTLGISDWIEDFSAVIRFCQTLSLDGGEEGTEGGIG